eukprot:4628821-Prymnesium_polylepis.1
MAIFPTDGHSKLRSASPMQPWKYALQRWEASSKAAREIRWRERPCRREASSRGRTRAKAAREVRWRERQCRVRTSPLNPDANVAAHPLIASSRIQRSFKLAGIAAAGRGGMLLKAHSPAHSSWRRASSSPPRGTRIEPIPSCVGSTWFLPTMVWLVCVLVADGR